MAVVIGLIALGVGLGTSLFLPVPQSLKTNFDAGQSLYALGEYEGAIIEYSKIVRFNSRAVRTDSVRINFESGLELPVVAAAWYKLGDAYKESAQHEKAIEAYKKVTVMDNKLRHNRGGRRRGGKNKGQGGKPRQQGQSGGAGNQGQGGKGNPPQAS